VVANAGQLQVFEIAKSNGGVWLPKALVFVTARNQVAYIPTRRGYSLLLSVVDPDALFRSLGAAAAPLPG
jgi:hypothetical protein